MHNALVTEYAAAAATFEAAEKHLKMIKEQVLQITKDGTIFGSDFNLEIKTTPVTGSVDAKKIQEFFNVSDEEMNQFRRPGHTSTKINIKGKSRLAA